MHQTSLHARLETAAGDRTYRHLAELTQQHPENVRRYMQGQSPSLAFVTNFCAALGISADWLLTGQGPMRVADVRSHMLRTSGPTDLLGAMADRLEEMRTRLERVEVYVQTMETRLRVVHTGGGADGRVVVEGKPSAREDHAAGTAERGSGEGAEASAAGASRADRIAGAVAERPPSSAD